MTRIVIVALALFIVVSEAHGRQEDVNWNFRPTRERSFSKPKLDLDDDGEQYLNSWAVKIKGGPKVADRIARRNGFLNLGPIDVFEDVYQFQKIEDSFVRSNAPSSSNLEDDIAVEFADQQVRRKYEKKSYMVPQDENFGDQWHLLNTISGYEGRDLQVEKAWLQGLTGCNVTIAIVDDGLDYNHPDLWPNFACSVSYDVIENDTDPQSYCDSHGTSCGGLAGAAKNMNCSVGIAPHINLGGIRLIGQGHTDMEAAFALSFKRDIVDVYSNSWGVPDSGYHSGKPGKLTIMALKEGVKKGRGGKGSIFVWANGNGGVVDDCAADGFASSIYTISVGAIGMDGMYSFFDEQCSAKMVMAYVTNMYGEQDVVAPMTGGTCRNEFGGTSAATPMVSGVIALTLEANPNLTWRDVQYLIVYTANTELTYNNWTINGAGLPVSRQYGFGVIDAEAMVTRARHWINVSPQIEDCVTQFIEVFMPSVTFSATLNYSGSIRYLEHVVVEMDISIPYNNLNVSRGSLEIELISPSGTRSILLMPRPLDDFYETEYPDWYFMSVMFWGEDPTGQWSLTVKTGDVVGVANITDVKFVFYGVSSIPESVKNIPERCHPDCSRGCAGNRSNQCDSCDQMRDSYTLECISQCPSGYTERNGYCYNASRPLKECDSPLKDKEECDLAEGYNLTCAAQGFTECCTVNFCSVCPTIPYCYCDCLCFLFDDCCDDVEEIGCMQNKSVMPSFPFVELESTPGVDTMLIDGYSLNYTLFDVVFPFTYEFETELTVSLDGTIQFGFSAKSVLVFATFSFEINETVSTTKFEIHEGLASEDILSFASNIVNVHQNVSFNATWLLVATWHLKNLEGLENTFQGMLLTDNSTSYAVFTYNCDSMTFSAPGYIGYLDIIYGEVLFHPASFRENSHKIACKNEPNSPWVNIVYELSLPEPPCYEGDLRLANSTYSYTSEGHPFYGGRVEVCYNEVYHPVCDEGWTDSEAAVVCNYIGLSYYIPMATNGTTFGLSDETPVLQNLMCYGYEYYLSSCPGYQLNNVTGDYCLSGNYQAGVRCVDVSTPTPSCSDGDIQLTNTTYSYYSDGYFYGGRVEICYNQTYHPVCDDGWTNKDAAVVCNHYGYSSPNYRANATGGNTFGLSDETPLAENLSCIGTEDSFYQCPGYVGQPITPSATCLTGMYQAGVRCIQDFLEWIELSNPRVFPPADDETEGPIQIPSPGFPFWNTVQTQVFIGTNGLISFGDAYNPHNNEFFMHDNNRYLIAPFWDDIDIRSGGNITYQTYISGDEIRMVNDFISEMAHPNDVFEGTWMLVVYWDAVHPFPSRSDSMENTFQAVLITDGVQSFAIFTYYCGLTEWDEGGTTTIGFNAGGQVFKYENPTGIELACINGNISQWSNVVYNLTGEEGNTSISLEMAEYTVREDQGSVEICLVVNTSVPTSCPIDHNVSVSIVFRSGNASQFGDYVPSSSSITIPQCFTKQCFEVRIVDDTRFESTEYFDITLVRNGLESHVDLERNTATVFITDDDTAVVAFSASAYSVEEGDTVSVCVRLNFRINCDVAFPFSVNITSEIVRATNNSNLATPAEQGDFAAVNFNQMFRICSFQQCFSLTTINDEDVEGTEVFDLSLRLSGQDDRLSIGSPNITRIYIEDDDSARLNVQYFRYTVNEGNGTIYICARVRSPFPVFEDCELNFSFSVRLVTTPGTADGSDYRNSFHIISFARCEEISCINIPIFDDNVMERIEETFLVSLESFNTPSAVRISSQPSTVTIIDNDGLTIGFEETAYSVIESSNSIQLCASIMRGQSAISNTIRILTSPDTAGIPFDFISVLVPVTFLPSSTRQCINIFIFNDDIVEDIESFDANLLRTAALDSRVTLAPQTTTVYIIDDDYDPIGYVCLDKLQYSVVEGEGRVEICANFIQLNEEMINFEMFIVPAVVSFSRRADEFDFNTEVKSIEFINSSSSCISIEIYDDDRVEHSREQFVVTLQHSNTSMGVKINSSCEMANINIIDDDIVYIEMVETDVLALESEDNVEICAVTSGSDPTCPIEFDVRFIIDFSDITAESSVDYRLFGGTFNLPRCGRILCLNLTIYDDDINEIDEVFTVTIMPLFLESPNIIVANDTIEVTIIDDDGFLIGPRPSEVIIQESSASANVCITFFTTVLCPISSPFNLTLVIEGDVTFSSVLQFPECATSVCVDVPIHMDDSEFGGSKKSRISISGAPPTSEGLDGTLTILEDDVEECGSNVYASCAKEYFIAFGRNDGGYSGPQLSLLVSSIEPGPVPFVVETLRGFSYNGLATNDRFTEVLIPNTFQLFSTGDTNKGIRVSTNSDSNLLVYGLNNRPFSSDTFLALPCQRLPVDVYEYILISYEDTVDNLYIVACEDNTAFSMGMTRGTLNQMQTYLWDRSEIMGERLISDKPLSVFTGHRCTNFPFYQRFCDHLNEQIPPTAVWGTNFLSASLAGRSSDDLYRIVASHVNTTVKINCTTLYNDTKFLALPGFQEQFLTPNGSYCSITSDQPILLMQFAVGGGMFNRFGDPFMMMIVPTNQYANNYLLSARPNFANYITVYVTPENYHPEFIFLDGHNLSNLTWNTVYNSETHISGYIAQINLTVGIHELYSKLPIGVSSYGLKRGESYGYPAGLRVRPPPVRCPHLEDPKDGSVVVTGDSVGGMANYSCNDGFGLKGEDSLTCRADGSWSKKPPICTPNCPDLSNPGNGIVSVSSRNFGGEALYTCNEGYDLVGESVLYCEDGGTWSGKAPVCRAICPKWSGLMNGTVQEITHADMDTAIFKCDPGFGLVGDSVLTCQINGSWSNTQPSCERVCKSLPILEPCVTITPTSSVSLSPSLSTSPPSPMPCTPPNKPGNIQGVRQPNCGLLEWDVPDKCDTGYTYKIRFFTGRNYQSTPSGQKSVVTSVTNSLTFEADQIPTGRPLFCIVKARNSNGVHSSAWSIPIIAADRGCP